MDNLDNLLSARLNKLGLNNELQAAYVLSVANRLANSRFEAIRFSHGILTVACPNSIAAQELRFESQTIISDINTKIKPLEIKRLSYRIRPNHNS